MTPEQIVKKQICDWLELNGALFTLHVRTFNRKFSSSKHMRAGWPDIHGVWKDGRALLIEVKAKGGTISEEQMRIIIKAKSLGGHAFFAYSLEDVQRELKGKS